MQIVSGEKCQLTQCTEDEVATLDDVTTLWLNKSPVQEQLQHKINLGHARTTQIQNQLSMQERQLKHKINLDHARTTPTQN